MKFENDFRKGSEILKNLRKVEAYKTIKVIVSSAYDNQVTRMEIMGGNMANAFVPKHNKNLIFDALKSFEEGENYWWGGIPKSIRLSNNAYKKEQSERFLKKIKYQLLPQEEKGKIKHIPKYEIINETHNKVLIKYYEEKKLDLPIALDFDLFHPEAEKALNADFTPTQWIIFKELAKGRTRKKVAANCNTTLDNINTQTGNILDKLGKGGHKGNTCILLLEALKMPILDVFNYVETLCEVTIISKYPEY
jgi:DNA-binding NarL/FixJ family response regulator